MVGGGGREHALAWKLAASPRVETVFVAPGNAGTAQEPGVVNIDIGINEIDQLVAFAKDNTVAFTVIGPEAPLVNGVVDAFDEVGLRCLGPNRGAAQLEGSKAFTKSFLKRHRIPTAAYSVFDDADEAIAWVKQHPGPCVIKADGLAAGKGVTVATTEQVAINAIHQCLRERAFGNAGERIVIEDYLVGEVLSASLMATLRCHLLRPRTTKHVMKKTRGQIPVAWGLIRRHRSSRKNFTCGS